MEVIESGMSVEAVAWAYAADASPTERNVLFALALFADDKGECWPGLDLICEIAKMKRVPVIRSINSLVERGLVERLERGHRGQSTRYRLKGIQFGEKSIQIYTRINNILYINVKELVYTNVYPIDPKGIESDTQSIGEYGQWMDIFAEITHIPELSIKPDKAAEAIGRMVKAGAMPEDMRSGYYEVKDNYTIVGPWSLITPTLNAMRKRKSNGDSPNKDDWKAKYSSV